MVVSSLIPFVDLLANHCLCHIVMPYFQLLWKTLTSWISVYFSVGLVVVYKVHQRSKADTEAAQGKILYRFMLFRITIIGHANALC